MNKPHKHAEVIKAWADGAEVQFRYNEQYPWRDLNSKSPIWELLYEYRVKPKTKKIRIALLANLNGPSTPVLCAHHNDWTVVEQRQDFVKWISDVIEYEE